MDKSGAHSIVGAQHAASIGHRYAIAGAACCAPTKCALALLLLLCSTLAQAIAPEGSWWNASYGYRQRIDIPAGGSALSSGYAVSVTLDHNAMVLAGRSQNDGDDVRIVYYNGTTWVELDRVVDNQSGWNLTTTRIWFDTQATINSGVTEDDYYVYYGNGAATAPPANAANVFTLYDDFSSATLNAGLWTGSGTSQASGILTCGVGCQLQSNTSFGGDYIFEASAALSTTTTSGTGGTFYYWLASDSNAYGGEHVGFYLAGNGSHTGVSRDTSTNTRTVTSVAANTYRTYAFGRIGTTTVRHFVAGTQVGADLTTANAVPNDNLPILVRNTSTAGSMLYDWVRVRPYRSAEPTLSLAGREQLAPIATYRLNDLTWNGTAGEVVDSASGLNGVAQGGAVTANTTPAIAGNPGTCRYGNFDGTNDLVEVADNDALDITAALTVAVWVYPRAWPSGGVDLKSIISKDTNFEFHLNPSGQVYWWWNGGTTITSSTTVPVNQWSHIAITYTSGSQRLYINGVLRGSATNTGALQTNTDPLQIGQDQNYAGRYWNGLIDEVNIYSTALSAAQITTLMNATQACPSTAHHYAITHDGYGIHCAAEPITVSVHDASHNAVSSFSSSMTLSSGVANGDWSLVSGNGTFSNGTANDGNATYQWSGSESTATFALTYRQGASSINIAATSATIADDNTEGNLLWGASGFTVTAAPLSNPPPSPITTFATAQTAATNFTLYLAAYGTTPTDTECGIIESYTGAKSINFWSAYANPSTGTRQVSITGTSTVAIGVTEGASVAQPVTFTNGQASVVASYRDAGSIQISMKDATVSQPATGIRGATNNFVVKPASFVLSNIRRTSDNVANPGAANASGAVFIAAGVPFSATVTAVDSAGAATPNFGRESTAESVRLQSNLVAPVAPPAVNNPAVVGSFGTFTNGVASGTAFSWSEVGIITLTPRLFDGDYLGAGDVIGTVSGNIGRFIPFNFGVTMNAASFASACSPGSYIYIGQPMSYAAPGIAPVLSVTARASGGATTQNYQGQFFKLASGAPNTHTYSTNTGTLDQSALNTVGNPVAVSLNGGLGTLTFSTTTGLKYVRTTPIAPFSPTLTLNATVLDSDGVAASTNTTVASTNPVSFGGISSPEQRYGRVAFRNAVGSELLNLPLAMYAEYFVSDTAGFTRNSNDSCTAGVTLSFSNFGGNLASGETCIIDSGSPGASTQGCATAGVVGQRYSSPPTGGDFISILRSSGAGNGGTVTVTATVPDWLRFDWDGSPSTQENPSGIATFGIFQGPAKRIFQGEK